MPRISIIVAFFNEELNLPTFRNRLEEAMARLGCDYEVLLVDDHSSDGGPAIARRWVKEDARARYLRLSRNSGSHAAFSAGLAHCSGDCVVLLAADLQDPPEFISQMLASWREGNQVVWARRAQRPGESRTTRFCAAAYYELMRRVALPEMPTGGADFLLMDRKVVEAYNSISEKNTSLLAMILWMGFRQTFLDYVKQPRLAGTTKWSIGKKLKLAVDSIVSFSYLPIRLMSVLGMVVSLVGLAYACFTVVFALCGNSVPGWASLMVVTLVLGGLQLLTLGVLGEYLWRTYDEVRGRPAYIVEEQCGSIQAMDKAA